MSSSDPNFASRPTSSGSGPKGEVLSRLEHLSTDAGALHITHLRRGDVLLVQATGRLAFEQVQALQARFAAAVGTEAHTLVVDNSLSLSVLRPDRPDAGVDELTLQHLDGRQVTLTVRPPSRPMSYDEGLAQAAAARPPRIGQLWPGHGGIYAGVARGADGAGDQHVILSPEWTITPMAWQAAMNWARSLSTAGFTDWALPTRAESALLFANVRDRFEARWHWTCQGAEADDSCAWGQGFNYGNQFFTDKNCEARACAVRRVPVQAAAV